MLIQNFGKRYAGKDEVNWREGQVRHCFLSKISSPVVTSFYTTNLIVPTYQRWSRGHKVRDQGHKKIRGQGQECSRTQRGSDLQNRKKVYATEIRKLSGKFRRSPKKKKEKSLLQNFVYFSKNSSVLQVKSVFKIFFRKLLAFFKTK